MLVVLSVMPACFSHADEWPETELADAVMFAGILTTESFVFTDPDPSDQPEGEPLPSEEEAQAAEDAALIGPEIEPEPTWLAMLMRDWKGEVRLGTDLSSGTSDRTRFRGGFNINRKYSGHKTALRTDYAFARTDGVDSENRLVNGVIQDWSTGQTKFSGVFARGTGELNRFRAYDYRLNVSSGGRYQIVKDDKTDALFRFGLSATREFGAVRDEWVPEGAFFFTLAHTINTKQKLSANVDYFPEIEQPSRYRLNARASWDYKIDVESGLSLRVGVENRYDRSRANRQDRNDLDLRAELVWQF